MPRIAVDLDVIRHALLDLALSEAGGKRIEVKAESPMRIGRAAIVPGANLSIRVLSRPADADGDGIWSADAEAHIPHTPGSAWIRYRLTAEVDGKLRFASASAGATNRIELTSYRIHAQTDGATRAIRRDIDSLHTILQLPDVRNMKPGEALAMEAAGTLTADVETSWADLLGNRLTAIQHAAGVRFPVAVRLRSGASASARVRVRDRFAVVISRRADGQYRFTVQKAQSADHRFSIDVSLGAEASAVNAVETALEPVFEAITGASLASVRRIANQIGIGALPSEDRDLLDRIARKLGLGSAAGREKAVLAGLEKLRKALRRELDESLRWKASTSFAYEYARIEETTAIVDFVLLDQSRLAADYALVTTGDLARLRVALAETGSREIVRYLNADTVTRSSSHGFSLGIGKWTMRARDESTFAQTTRTSLDGMRLITSRGTRRYQEKNIPQNDIEWTVDLKAQMTEFRRRPSTRDFDVGLHYAVTLERDTLGEGDLARMLDFAAMWEIAIPPEAGYSDAIGRKATLRVQLLFERDDLMQLLTTMLPNAWASSLAAAMPYMSTFEERRSHVSRRALYTPVWERWLAGEEHGASGWSSLLRQSIHSGLQVFEDRALPGSFAWTVGEGHPQLRARLDAFRRGIAGLRGIMTHDERPEAIGGVYAAIEQMWSQRLYVAASGSYLLAGARAAGVDVSRSLQIEFEDVAITS